MIIVSKKYFSPINMFSMKAHNHKGIFLIVMAILCCLEICSSKVQDLIYPRNFRNISQIYSGPTQYSFPYPSDINKSELYYTRHYGQSEKKYHAITNNALDSDQQDFRDERFLSPFTLVRFANVECESNSNSLTGTCYTFWDCWKGVAGDADVNLDWSSCAGGFGTCCTSILGCGGFSKNNNTWLRSPGYPNTINSGVDCQQTIYIEEDICQLRLEIEDLSLNYPDNTGTCTTDYLTVSQDIKFDKLCGVTKNNHFYLDVMYSMSNKVEFNFHVDGSTSFDRSWSIRVTKICCHSDEEVPRGCGQYYTGTSGTINGLNNEAPDTDDYVLSNMNYAACVRMERGYCKNTYSEPVNEGWTTICPDVFERPGQHAGSTAGVRKCSGNGQGFANPNIGATYSYNFLSPHYFKLDTTISTTNTHISTDPGPNYGGSYNIMYQQTEC